VLVAVVTCGPDGCGGKAVEQLRAVLERIAETK
jgi:hypothetical protein